MLISGPFALDSLLPIPWKNGGGFTRNVAVEPAEAGMDHFLWRISVAEIRASGSFSAFPGVDRTILLWHGAGLTLRSPTWPDHALTTTGEPFVFAGEEDVVCQLADGPSQDLNLMMRRGAVDASLHVAINAVNLHSYCDELVILCAEGSLQVQLGEHKEYLLECDYFLRVSRLAVSVTLTPRQANTRFAYASIRYR
ncbi:MAG TPA: HutD family protein [Acidobacteriaceae bacterium]